METSAETIQRLTRELAALRAAAQALRDTFPCSTPWSPEEVRLADALKGVPEQPAKAALDETRESIEALRESLETAWEAIELHEAMLRAIRNALVMTPVMKRDLDPVLHALDAIDARKAGGHE
jgi:hypothetical protein